MVRDKAKELLAKVLGRGIDEIPEDASQKTLDDWDSLHHLNLAVEIESEFDISLEPEEIGEMTSLDAIVSVVTRYLEAAK